MRNWMRLDEESGTDQKKPRPADRVRSILLNTAFYCGGGTVIFGIACAVSFFSGFLNLANGCGVLFVVFGVITSACMLGVIWRDTDDLKREFDSKEHKPVNKEGDKDVVPRNNPPNQP